MSAKLCATTGEEPDRAIADARLPEEQDLQATGS